MHDGDAVVARGQAVDVEQTARSTASLTSVPEVRRDDGRVVAHDSAGGPLRDDPPEVEHVRLVADVEHERHVVVDEQHADASVGEVGAAGAERGGLGRVEPGGRLVEQHQLRPGGKRPCDPDELDAARATARPACGPRASARPTASSA